MAASFEQRTIDGWTCLVRAELANAAATALTDDTQGVAVHLGGRGALRSVPLETACEFPVGGEDVREPEELLVRQYRRGGLLRKLRRDRFLLRNRALQEWRVHSRLADLGLPVAPLVGVAWRRVDGVWFEGRIATLRLDARSLLAVLREGGRGADEVLRTAGAELRRFHEAGLYHPDLQLENVLVGKRVYVIDFDKARLLQGCRGGRPGHDLLRFRRSFEKNGVCLGYFEMFMQGYGAATLPIWRQRMHSGRAVFSTFAERFRHRG